ncbi:hypothetical protein ACX0G9_14375 [Flavitalea flava]
MQLQKSFMFKTGNNFADYFLIVNTFLPLIPVALLALRKNFGKEPLNFLMVICLINFLEGLVRGTPSLNNDNQTITTNIFSLAELILLFQLFKTTLKGKLKEALNILGAALLAGTITYFSVKGWGYESMELSTLQNGFLIGVILLILPPLVRSTDLFIFDSPLFWIAGGTLFYFFLFILLEWTSPFSITSFPNAEKMTLLIIASIIRYVFYILAVLFPPQKAIQTDSTGG